MHHIGAPKKLRVGLLALVLGALISGSAAAAGRQQVIPYLSHGVGVDQSLYSGTSTKHPLVIPYLSHGVGVDQSLYVGGSHHLRRTAATAPVAKAVPDAFERAVARREAARASVIPYGPHHLPRTTVTAPVAKAVPDAFERAVARDDAAKVMSLRPDDRAGLRGIQPSMFTTVSSSTSLRPDDRAGTRGVGASTTSTTSASVDSSSGTDWSPALYAGAGFIGAMLVMGGAFALTRRQHNRVATH